MSSVTRWAATRPISRLASDLASQGKLGGQLEDGHDLRNKVNRQLKIICPRTSDCALVQVKSAMMKASAH